MPDDFLPITVFRQRSIDEERVEGRGQKEKPKWVLTGDDLVNKSHALVSDFVESYAGAQHNPDLPYVYEVTLDKRDTAKSKRRAITDMFEVDGADGASRVMGMRGSKSLIVRAWGNEQLQTIQTRLEDYERYDMALSCIDSIERFHPTIETEIDKDVYKVRLLDFEEESSPYAEILEEPLGKLGISHKQL